MNLPQGRRQAPRVCIVSCQHGPRDARVVHKLAAGLRDAGCHVIWVGPSNLTEFGETGIEARFFPAASTRLQRPLQWLRAYLTARAVSGVDVYCGVSPDSAYVAIKLASAQGAHAIFDLHEVYHQEMLSAWGPAVLRPLLSSWVKYLVSHVARHCAVVVASSDRVLAPYRHICRAALVLRNCAPSWFVQQSGVRTDDTRLVVMHGKVALGNSLSKRGTATLLQAMALTRARAYEIKAIMFDNFQEDTGSDGMTLRHDFLDQVEKLGLDGSIDMRGGIPITQMPAVLRQVNVGIIAYSREFGENSLPGRLFEYMAAAIPVIGPTYSQDIVEIIDREQCGLVADCEDPDAVANALSWLAENPAEARQMGMRGRAAFLARHNLDQEIRPLVAKLHDLMNEQPGLRQSAPPRL